MSSQTTAMEVLIRLKDEMSGAMGNITKSLNGLKNLVVGVGAALAAAFGIKSITHFGKDIIEAAEHIKKLSTITGISTISVQKFGAAAMATGANFDRLSTGMKLLAEHAEKASEGNKGMVEMFLKVGIAVNDANGHLKNGEQLMMEFADVLHNTNSQTERMALAVEFLGRSGEELLPVLQLGSAAMKEIGEAAEKAGFIMSKKTVNDLATMGRQFEQLKTGFMNMVANWLSQSNITIPKILAILIEWSIKTVEIFGEVKKAFNAVAEFVGFMGEAIIVWFQAIRKAAPEVFEAISNAIMVPLEATLSVVKSIIPALDIMMLGFKLAIEKGKEWAAGIIKDSPALAEAAAKTSEAWGRMSGNIENYNKDTDKSTKELGKTIDQWGADSIRYIQLTSKVTNQQDEENKANAKSRAEYMKTMMGGFETAIQEFIARGKTWKEAWLEMFSSMESGITGVLDKFIMEGGKMKDFMSDLFKSIERSFVHMLTTMATQQMMQGVLGLFMPGTAAPNSNMTPTGASPLGAATSAAGANANPGQSWIGTMFSGAGGGTSAAGGGGLMSTSLGGSLTLGGALGGIGLGVAGYSMYNEATTGDRVNVTHSTVGGALSGAAAGAMIGSVIPGIGTVIGGVVGALVGGVSGYIGGKSAKRKQQKAEDEAAQAAQEQEQAMRAQARQLIMADIRAKYGGGLADTSVMPEIGEIMSHGISDTELDKIGAAAVNSQASSISKEISNIQVGSPNITVNAQVAGAYDVQRLAEDLGLQLSSSIRSAASGAGI